jgi:hypothetical protein
LSPVKTLSKKHLLLFSVLSALLFAISGCSSQSFSNPIILPENDLNLTEDDRFSIFISPQSIQMDRGPGTNTSYLSIVDKSGHIKSIKTDPMERGIPLWGSNGIRFSDRSNDYIINRSVTKKENRKPEYLQSTEFSGDGNKVLSLYNGGWESEHYSMIAEETSGTEVRKTNVDGLYFSSSVCGDILYGVGESFRNGPHLNPGESFSLAKLTGNSREIEDIRSTFNSARDVTEGGMMNAPCVDGKIYSITDFPETEKSHNFGTARTWNTVTGRFTEKRLKLPSGEDFPPPMPGYLDRSYYSRKTLSNEKLQWLSPDSIMRETNFKTGETRDLYSIPVDTDMGSNGDIFFDISSNHIFVLTSRGSNSTIQIFSRIDGHREEEIKIPMLGRLTTQARTVQGFTAAPNSQ